MGMKGKGAALLPHSCRVAGAEENLRVILGASAKFLNPGNAARRRDAWIHELCGRAGSGAQGRARMGG
jgi:hypothetical protein